jgi:hypothetical protein
MEFQDFAKEYQSKSDEELLRLELVSEHLTPEATAALQDELVRRQINGTGRIDNFREQEAQRQKEQAKDPGRLFFVHTFGAGRGRFGKAHYVYDSETGMERFTTTVFVILFYFPLVPTGTYLAERKRGLFSNPIIFLEKLPLDWEQILRVWVVAAGSLLALIWIVKLLPRLLQRH